MSFSNSFPSSKICGICHNEKTDVRYVDLLEKWICSDCMGVKEFEVGV